MVHCQYNNTDTNKALITDCLAVQLKCIYFDCHDLLFCIFYFNGGNSLQSYVGKTKR
jgi:hypothetical protein